MQPHHPPDVPGLMTFSEQMATKLLAQAIQSLGLALNETLCVEPDHQTIRTLVKEVKESLSEFEEAYFS